MTLSIFSGGGLPRLGNHASESSELWLLCRLGDRGAKTRRPFLGWKKESSENQEEAFGIVCQHRDNVNWWTGGPPWFIGLKSCRVGIHGNRQEALFRFPNASVMGYDLDQSVVQRAQQRLKHRAQVQSDTCFNARTLCSGDVGTGELFRLMTMEQQHTSVMPSHFYVFSHVTIRVSKAQGFLLKLPWLCDFDESHMIVNWLCKGSQVACLPRITRHFQLKDLT